MDRDEAVTIVVRAGKEGQKRLLEALFQEMNTKDMEEIFEKNGYQGGFDD